ncbi:glycosyltransferase family 4 protein, partial [bacterium]|nr:glycosyltransferase family 4 protein [bacterium]
LNGNDYILFASRLVPEKGCHQLISAYQKLRHPIKKLVIAGDCNHEDKYLKELLKFRSNEILFLGFVKGRLLQELYSNCYIYVLPSNIEGLSTGLLEAMSYGNCVLVSDIEENIEVTQDSGVPFFHRDVNDLTDKLEYLIKNEHVVEQYRNKATERISEHCTWDEVVDRYERLYCSLLS